MAEKRYYWLKLYDDFFGSLRIKKLRKLAGGDTYTIIYLKMQLKAMKTDGILQWKGIEDDFASELALDIDEDAENVKVVIAYLLSCGLAETDDNVSYFFPYAVENTGSEGASAQRVRDFRNRKALQGNEPVTQTKQICHGEIEKEIEKDIEIDIEKRGRTDYLSIVRLYNETCVSFPAVRSVSEARKKSIRARLNSYSVDDFETLFRKAEASSFLKGSNKRNWQATFDWLIQDSNMAKVLDGNYDDKDCKVNGRGFGNPVEDAEVSEFMSEENLKRLGEKLGADLM